MELTRRHALLGAATGAGALSLPGCAHPPAAATVPRRTFVLVHGAWHGGWCWRDLRELLEAQGHRVHTPSLTGLAERSHLLSPAVDLQTHIDDIVNLFRWEDLQDVVLVAHSYGGWPVTGALERVAAQVRSLVYLDAYVPEHGQRVMDFNSAQFQQQMREAIARGEAGRPVPDVRAFGILDPAKAAWVQARMTPQPTAIAVQPIQLSGAIGRVARKTYIRTPRYPQPAFDRYLANAQRDPGWRTYVLPPEVAGHDAMVDAPQRLAQILAEVA